MEIERLVWLPASDEKLRQHGIERAEVDGMVLRNEWAVTVHEAYPDQIRMIGPTPAERIITVALQPTDDPTVWRPITGWDSTEGEKEYYWEEYR